VFKLSAKDMAAGVRQEYEAVIGLNQLSTRRYYPGKYTVTFIANGRRLGSKSFRVSA
jgi:hypothetical protein